MQKITILGSTGSIGTNTLDMIKNHSEKFQAYALTGNQNVQKMYEQCVTFRPQYAAMANEEAALKLLKRIKEAGLPTMVLAGAAEINQLAGTPEVDQVMAAIVGSAGLLPTLTAIKRGKRVLLANKESLVMCGRLFMEAVQKYNAMLLPVDSEHNAIFQSMPAKLQYPLGYESLSAAGISQIILTGSGGPFRDRCLSQMYNVLVSEAIAHPNWTMGKKISVDSATMMNKGLEYIEARWLFNAAADEMEIVIHPQSIIHSMVRYRDGSIIAQLGNPDMRIPIAHVLAYPHRITTPICQLDFAGLSGLTFSKPDMNKYPCLRLAMQAFAQGQAATTILNAANEIAVDAFLMGRIGFMQIVDYIEQALLNYAPKEPSSVEDVLAIDRQAKKITTEILNKAKISVVST